VGRLIGRKVPSVALVVGMVVTWGAGVGPLDGWRPALRGGPVLMFLVTVGVGSGCIVLA
jgi:hypothetical protein